MAGCLAPVIARAQADTARYELTFRSAEAARHVVHVDATFTVRSADPLLLSMPAWTPGAYEISNFARWVRDFRASANGNPLRWDKLDFDTWRINPAGSPAVTVSFDFQADTLDNGIAWSRRDFLLVNGTTVFLYPEGRGSDFAATVTVRTEPQWKVVSGLAHAADGSYSATNYHDLVDNPLFVGRFDLDSARIAERWIRLATYPVGSVSGPARQEAWTVLKKIIPVEASIFRDVPFADYTVMQIADSGANGYSGLEHASSHVDIVSPLVFGRNDLWSLYAHEIFHAWNVKRLRPADLWPYRYDAPQPTPWLWMSEGITDYYADLAEVRGGVVDSSGFLRLTTAKLEEVAAGPAVSLEDASVNTWVHPVDGSEYLYYPKGSLTGFALDLLIRDASDNAHSLDDVMRELYRDTYQKGRGFTAGDWWGAVSRAANGKSFADFNARYIDGRDALPWPALLPLAGLHIEEDTTRFPQLGVQSLPDSEGVVVSLVEPGSAADEAGVRLGDVLVTVGDISVRDEAFAARFRLRFAKQAGAALPIVVRRDGATLRLNGRVKLTTNIERRVAIDRNASPKAVRVRSGILHGTP